MSRVAAVLAVLGTLTVLFAAGPAAASAASRSGCAVKLGFLSKKQSEVASGKARVKLGSTCAGQRVKLSLEAKQPWSKWTPAGSLRVRTKRARATRTARVRLHPAALRILRNCGRPQLRLTAVYRSKGKIRKKTLGSGKLGLDRARCAVPIDVDLSKAATCDFIAAFGNACMAPFPNNFYTRKDKSSETGRRVQISSGATPQNDKKKPIATDALNLADGFSAGPLISVLVPGMDNQAAFDQTGIVPITDMSQTYAADQAVVLIDAKTGKRQLIWGELDSNASKDRWRNLIIRPGKNLTNGHRYIVALRNMKGADGKLLQAPPGFRLYRDNQRTLNRTIEKRRAGFESIFHTLGRKGIKRKSLYLAWDFTVASTKNITGRMLSIRDRAFAELGDTNLTDGTVQGDAPDFQVTSTVDYPTPTGDGEQNIRTVIGTFTVPCYLSKSGCPPGDTFNLDDNQMPIRIPGNTMTANFICNIPRSAIDEGTGVVIKKVRPSLYGHGLFGKFSDTNSGNVRKLGTENGVMVCGTDFSGMATEDVLPSAIPALQDLSKFSSLPDRLQQGFLNFMFLGRLLIHPDGLASDPAFKFNGESVVDTDHVFYYGNSQGGIAGGALTAVSPDVTRSVLYVPGMNYSTLLTRSIDFKIYSLIFYSSYKSEVERPLLFSLMQMLWDRGEPNGYANNMTSDPLPNTPPHKVMIEMAYGDHQVANIATEVEARTIGAPLRMPTLDSNRQPAGMINPFFDHEILGDLNGPAADGNAFFIWDIGPKRGTEPNLFGTEPPPNGNIPPPESSGIDPHDTVINNSWLIRKQIADFLQTGGKVTNPCGLNPCYAAGWNSFS